MSDDPELRDQMLRTARKGEEEIDRVRRNRRIAFWFVLVGVVLVLGFYWYAATHQTVQ